MVKTKATSLVLHRPTGRAYSLNDGDELVEPLILDAEVPTKYQTVRCFWKPMCVVPAWAAGIRDHEFDMYIL